MKEETQPVARLRTGPLGENAYALVSGTTSVLVDPGDEPEKILDFLSRLNLSPDLIVLTHGHLDHTAAIPALVEAWKGRDVRIAIHEADARYLGSRGAETNRRLFAAIGGLQFFDRYWRGMPEPDILLAEGMTLPGTTLKVLHTPGHSAGSVCLYDAQAGFVITGDTLFRDGIGRSDGFDADTDALQLSLERLASLPPDTLVWPGHGVRTTIGRELHPAHHQEPRP